MLQINRTFNHPLEVGSLPSTLTYLVFGDAFGQPLPAGVLPASLLHLSAQPTAIRWKKARCRRRWKD